MSMTKVLNRKPGLLYWLNIPDEQVSGGRATVLEKISFEL